MSGRDSGDYVVRCGRYSLRKPMILKSKYVLSEAGSSSLVFTRKQRQGDWHCILEFK